MEIFASISNMITASKTLKALMDGQKDRDTFTKKAGISTGTWYRLMNGNDISSEVVGKILNVTGFEFEKAFEVKDEQ